MLYFVKAEGVGHIKIGFVEGVDATKRLCELQVGSPVRLTLLGTQPGDRAAEMDLHRRFASACVHGEWFQPVEELLDLIGNVEGLKCGPVAVIERSVQIKILTVNNKQLSLSFLKQIPEEAIVSAAEIESKGIEIEEVNDPTPHHRGIIWGWVETPPNTGSSLWLIWQKGTELRRQTMDFRATCNQTLGAEKKKETTRAMISDLWGIPNRIRDCWEAFWKQSGQLFIQA